MKKSLFFIASALIFISSAAFAQEIPVNFVPHIIPQLITIRQQDIDSGKRIQQEKQELRDFKNRKENREKIIKELKKRRGELIKHVEVPKYTITSVYVKNIEIAENGIITKEEVADIIKNYEAKRLTATDVKELVKRIDEICVDKGYITAFAYLPKQDIKNGLLKIAIKEGKVGKINIIGNRWIKESYIRSRINVNEGENLNLPKLANSLLVFSRYNAGVTAKADLNPGETEGTTDIDIKVEEIAPYRAMATADNSGRDTTGKNRAGLLAGHDSLFGYRDKLSGGIFANRHSKTPFIDYNIPINKYDGRIGIAHSYNEAKVGHGPLENLNIKSRTQNSSIYYTHPFIHKLHDELNGKLAYTYKSSVTSAGGRNLNRDRIPEIKSDINYRHDTLNGVWYLAQSISYAAPWYQKKIDYFKFDGSVTRLQNFGHRILGYFRGLYQYVPQDKVPVVDQMSAGGLGTVRGYAPDVMIIAKSGYQLNAEIYLPAGPQEFSIGGKSYRTDDYVRPFVFTDYASLYPYKGDNFNYNDILFSAGAGLRLQLPFDIILKATYGVPLKHNKHDYHHGNWNLEISIAPDFNKFFGR